MNIKRVVAPDMRQAIRKVRNDLGPDAVILSNRKTDEGIELLAAMDYDSAAIAASVEPEPVVEEPAGIEQAPARPPAAAEAPANPAISLDQDPALHDLRQEMRSLRSLVESQFAEWSWDQVKRRQPARAELMDRLTGLGFGRDLATSLVQQVPENANTESAWPMIEQHLAASIPVSEVDIVDQGGVLALLGPTGVGKTTSIAKLAARFCLRHGARHLALITTDTYRIGAQEQLYNYGRILDVPVRSVASADELTTAINAFADKRLVLVDTAGMSPRDLRIREQIQILNSGNAAIRAWIVLSAATQPGALEDAIKAFGTQDLQGCVLTKMDECQTLGGVLDVVLRHKLPVAYIGDGQRVPEDIHLARAGKLAQRCMIRNDHAALDEAARQAAEVARTLTKGGAGIHAHV